MKLKFSCPCHFGLESVLKFEVNKIGGEDIVTTDGKVTFYGDEGMIARANICLATAERVLVELSSFTATSFEELFLGVKKIPLENFIDKNDAFPVKGHCLDSKLHSVPDCQRIVKKAAVERLKEKHGISWFDETGATHQLQFTIFKDTATIYLDTTGAGLHKRGYRRNSNDAPIKETLAAGIVDLARVRSNSVVADPMCGSGTLLIESAYKALNVAPGLRRKFSAESWKQISPEVWKNERERAISAIDKQGSFRAYGSDIDGAAAALTEQNAKKAGIGSKISVDMCDVRKFRREKGTIALCNPPYGERMLEVKEAERLYGVLGERLRPDSESPAYIISPHEDFETYFGKKADKKRKLYNGMIKCYLYMYFK